MTKRYLVVNSWKTVYGPASYLECEAWVNERMEPGDTFVNGELKAGANFDYEVKLSVIEDM